MFKKFAVAVGAAAVLVGAAQAENITGAGATFPAPVYSAWAQTYRASSGNELNYQAIGSGGGIRQIKAKTVDFGASDKPLKPADLDEAGLMQFPTVIGGVVPVLNVPGVNPGRLRLTGSLLAEIYMGHITRWNDAQIAKINPQIKMPALPITVVHRSDGSGTSFIFTSYLSMKNADWAKSVGASDSVSWPVGLGGKGNDGVSAFVKQTKGSIGYVEYAYAKKNGTPYILVQNKAGAYPQPNGAAFAAAAASAPWGKTPGNYIMLLDQPGAKAWPISGATFILMYKNPSDPARSANVLKFFDWAYKNGDKTASSLDYVPLPASVKMTIRKQWASEITAGGKPVYVSK
ncbi:phosphate ABC transporter substrate-binding protein PstS [Croceicoccus estronivorus]|uniref:phosphate ABC transporter substrate-binding protein PstS n=1 Tax=Croceicoccus estronivorus TaxID=1172626 RepID=UPI00083602C2|nr:phosphate ABC transporter substrate-binding protein PstS [Croceicoccus estronivorus]OCC25031.1 phosphate ABC transporter substrate-binding protein PstS [Croceicoccus estronivorus]